MERFQAVLPFVQCPEHLFRYEIGCTEPQNHKKGPRRACAGALPVRKEKKENVIKQKAPLFPRTAAPLLVLEFTPLPPICQAPPPKFSRFA